MRTSLTTPASRLPGDTFFSAGTVEDRGTKAPRGREAALHLHRARLLTDESAEEKTAARFSGAVRFT